jgi:O-antigen/teichoic acid export membrane protein
MIINRLLEKFFVTSSKGEFAKNTYILVIGTALAQVFPMFIYPVLGRMYQPAVFGLLATLLSITSILAVIATGKYENCVLIATTRTDAINILGLTLIISFSFLSIAFFMFQVLGNSFAVWFKEPNLNRWLFICPISAYSITIFNCYNEWCVRNKYFRILSWNKVINSAAINLNKLLLGFIKIFSNGLVFGDFVGRIISAAGCVIRGLQKDKDILKVISVRRMKILAKQYAKFPKTSMPAQLLNTIGMALPVLLIGAYFNNVEVGYYAMTLNVLSMPSNVVSTAIKDVFRQRASVDYFNQGSCTAIFNKLLQVLFFWGILGSIILFLLLPDIFSFVLGNQWRVAGIYSRILLPMITLDFIATSISGILIITEKLNVILNWQIYYVGITIASLLAGGLVFHDIKITLACFSLGRSTAYLAFIVLSYRYSKGIKALITES